MARINATLSFEGIGLIDGEIERETGLIFDAYKFATVYHPSGYAWGYIKEEADAQGVGAVLEPLLRKLNGRIELVKKYLLARGTVKCFLSIYCDNVEGEPSAEIRLSSEQLQILSYLEAELSLEVVYT